MVLIQVQVPVLDQDLDLVQDLVQDLDLDLDLDLGSGIWDGSGVDLEWIWDGPGIRLGSGTGSRLVEREARRTA